MKTGDTNGQIVDILSAQFVSGAMWSTKLTDSKKLFALQETVQTYWTKKEHSINLSQMI